MKDIRQSHVEEEEKKKSNVRNRNSELANRLSVKLRIVIGRRRIDYLRRRSGSWLRRKRSGDERRRWNRGGRRRSNRGRGLRRLKRQYARQKELEQARSEKWKAVAMEESGEEMQKELQGSNKKVSKMFTSGFSD
jgi:hypothetical protein